MHRCIRNAHVDINGGDGENLANLLSSVIPPTTRTLLAQGRPQVASGTGGANTITIEEALKTISELKVQLTARDHTIAQSKANSERYKAVRKENWERKKREYPDASATDKHKKPAQAQIVPKGNQQVADGRARQTAQANFVRTGPSSYILRTSPDSEDEDQPTTPVSRAFMARILPQESINASCELADNFPSMVDDVPQVIGMASEQMDDKSQSPLPDVQAKSVFTPGQPRSKSAREQFITTVPTKLPEGSMY